jgi:hypothetical protein
MLSSFTNVTSNLISQPLNAIITDAHHYHYQYEIMTNFKKILILMINIIYRLYIKCNFVILVIIVKFYYIYIYAYMYVYLNFTDLLYL